MKLLVVEDTAPLRQRMAEHLRDRGYAVDETGEGDEGLWFIRENRYSLVVLDLMLPDRNGLDLLEEVRRSKGDTSVLIVTAKDAIEDRVRGLDAGADDYLVKPFSLDELAARVRVLVRRTFGHRHSKLHVGQLEIDPGRRVVRAGQQDLEITGMEFSILELMALREGEVVSRCDMWEQLYSFDEDAGSNVVEVLIWRLRKKIKEAGLPKMIHTRRGEGYVLELKST